MEMHSATELAEYARILANRIKSGISGRYDGGGFVEAEEAAAMTSAIALTSIAKSLISIDKTLTVMCEACRD